MVDVDDTNDVRPCAKSSNIPTVAPGYNEPGHSESLAIMNGKSRNIRAPPNHVCYSEKRPYPLGGLKHLNSLPADYS